MSDLLHPFRFANAIAALPILAFSVGAVAADWRLVPNIKREGVKVEADASSLVQVGDVVIAWSRETYDKDQLMLQKGAFTYRTAMTRMEFDCAKRTFRLLTFSYADKDGEVRQRTSESETRHMEAASAEPESLGEALLESACSLRIKTK